MEQDDTKPKDEIVRGPNQALAGRSSSLVRRGLELLAADLSPKRARILIVNSQQSVRELLEIFLKKEGFAVTSVSSAEEGLAQVNRSVFDIIISKLKMPDMSGLDLLRELRNTTFNGQFILLTSSSTEAGLHALKMGAYAYVLLTENFMEELKLVLHRALRESSA